MKIVYNVENFTKSLPKKEKLRKISDFILKLFVFSFASALLLTILNMILEERCNIVWLDNKINILSVSIVVLAVLCGITYIVGSLLDNYIEKDIVYDYHILIQGKKILKSDIQNKTLFLDLKDNENNVEKEKLHLDGFSIKYKTDIKETEINLDEKIILIPYELEESK